MSKLAGTSEHIPHPLANTLGFRLGFLSMASQSIDFLADPLRFPHKILNFLSLIFILASSSNASLLGQDGDLLGNRCRIGEFEVSWSDWLRKLGRGSARNITTELLVKLFSLSVPLFSVCELSESKI